MVLGLELHSEMGWVGVVGDPHGPDVPAGPRLQLAPPVGPRSQLDPVGLQGPRGSSLPPATHFVEGSPPPPRCCRACGEQGREGMWRGHWDGGWLGRGPLKLRTERKPMAGPAPLQRLRLGFEPLLMILLFLYSTSVSKRNSMKSQTGQAHAHDARWALPRRLRPAACLDSAGPSCYVHSHCGRPPRAAASHLCF